MSERLSKKSKTYRAETMEHVNEYADAGLRTLLIAYRELNEVDYRIFSEKFHQAKTCVSADRDALIEEATEMVERDLILLGATAVEDKLQNGVITTYKRQSNSSSNRIENCKCQNQLFFASSSVQVPDCIDKLAQAGIKIWVLTGDKMETAINIGYESNLICFSIPKSQHCF